MRISPRQRARAVTGMLAVAACALLLTGCAQPDPVVAPHATSTAKPLFASDAEALAAATKAYAAYLSVTDLLINDTASDPEQLRQVATGKQLSADLKAVSDLRDEGFRGTGATKFEDATLQQYTPSSVAGTVVIYVCEDISGTDLLGPDGVTILAPDRASRARYEITFAALNRSHQLLVEDKEKWGDKVC